MQQSMIPGFLGIHGYFINENFTYMGKQCTGHFSMGMGEVQLLQMNQSHNDDVMNMNMNR